MALVMCVRRWSSLQGQGIERVCGRPETVTSVSFAALPWVKRGEVRDLPGRAVGEKRYYVRRRSRSAAAKRSEMIAIVCRSSSGMSAQFPETTVKYGSPFPLPFIPGS